MKSFVRTGIALAAIAFALVGTANAADITLSDRNTTVIIDPNSQAGMHTWTVNGVDQMFQQWFWFRVGSIGPELSLDTLDLTPGVSTANLNGRPGDDVAHIQYDGALGLSIGITYTLSGGLAGTQASDVGEVITIDNNTGAAIDLHFFQYADFDLNGESGNQLVEFLSPNKMRQSGNGIQLTETVVVPNPTHHEANTFPTTLGKLNDLLPTTLNDANSAFGDATWAFQWDVTIANGGTFQISKDKNLSAVPEPSSLVLLAIGTLGSAFGAWRRRRVA
jgi:hypothetical protein